MITSEKQHMGTILLGVEKITYLISRCKLYELLYLQEPRLTEQTDQADLEQATSNLRAALVALYVLMLKFLDSSIRAYSKSSVNRQFSAMLNPGDPDSFLDTFKESEMTVYMEASICETIISRGTAHTVIQSQQEVRQLLHELERPLLRVERTVECLSQHIQGKERSEILNWVSKLPYEEYHQIAKNGLTNGTGEWLLSHEKYAEWRHSSASTILWLYAPPGYGKTKLVSCVVKDLLDQLQSNDNNEAIAYFYCNRNHAERQDPQMILNSFVRQLSLSRGNDSIQQPIILDYKKKAKRGFPSGDLKIEESQVLLGQLACNYPQITLVVDALDECNPETRGQLMAILDQLIESSLRPIKIFISSRPDRDVKDRFECGPNIGIIPVDNEGDIAKFIDDRIRKSPPAWRSQLGASLLNEIKAALIDKSQGMYVSTILIRIYIISNTLSFPRFQWTHLRLDQVQKLWCQDDVRERLKKLPTGLSKAYDEIFERIQKQEGSAPAVARRAFQWVMCSREPLEPLLLVAASC